jgi:hypothetical protein
MLKLAIAIGLGAAAWYWRKDIASFVDSQFPSLGGKASEAVNRAEHSAEKYYEEARSRIGG